MKYATNYEMNYSLFLRETSKLLYYVQVLRKIIRRHSLYDLSVQVPFTFRLDQLRCSILYQKVTRKIEPFRKMRLQDNAMIFLKKGCSIVTRLYFVSHDFSQISSN